MNLGDEQIFASPSILHDVFVHSLLTRLAHLEISEVHSHSCCLRSDQRVLPVGCQVLCQPISIDARLEIENGLTQIPPHVIPIVDTDLISCTPHMS